MEKIEKHPSHFKTTSYVGAALLLLAVVSFAVGIYLQHAGRIELSQLFALSFLIHAALLIAWLFLRMKSCRCPSCGKWLTESTSQDRHQSRRFICRKCGIIWDTGYVMYFDSDDPG